MDKESIIIKDIKYDPKTSSVTFVDEKSVIKDDTTSITKSSTRLKVPRTPFFKNLFEQYKVEEIIPPTEEELPDFIDLTDYLIDYMSYNDNTDMYLVPVNLKVSEESIVDNLGMGNAMLLASGAPNQDDTENPILIVHITQEMIDQNPDQVVDVTNITPGWYITLSRVKVIQDNSIYWTADPSLINVPRYDITNFPTRLYELLAVEQEDAYPLLKSTDRILFEVKVN